MQRTWIFGVCGLAAFIALATSLRPRGGDDGIDAMDQRRRAAETTGGDGTASSSGGLLEWAGSTSGELQRRAALAIASRDLTSEFVAKVVAALPTADDEELRQIVYESLAARAERDCDDSNAILALVEGESLAAFRILGLGSLYHDVIELDEAELTQLREIAGDRVDQSASMSAAQLLVQIGEEPPELFDSTVRDALRTGTSRDRFVALWYLENDEDQAARLIDEVAQALQRSGLRDDESRMAKAILKRNARR